MSSSLEFKKRIGAAKWWFAFLSLLVASIFCLIVLRLHLPSKEKQGSLQELACDAISALEKCEVYASDHPWLIMHGLLAFGKEREIFTLPGSGERILALNALLQSRTEDGKRILSADHGELVVAQAPHRNDFEDHKDQLAFILTQVGVSLDYSLFSEGSTTFFFEDLLQVSQKNAQKNEELSWTLPAIATGIGLNCRWENQIGELMDVPSLVASLLKENIADAPCAGTHLLYALATIYNLNKNTQVLPPEQIAEVQEFLDNFIVLAKQNQNEDGSFSLSWMFKRRLPRAPEKSVYASGHMLEWIAAYCPREILKEEWCAKLVRSTAESVLSEIAASGAGKEKGYHSMSSVPYTHCCHAVHGLKLYIDKMRAN